MGRRQGPLEDLELTAMESHQGTFKGRRVLVTGHTGFKGSWLALWLNELGAEVTGYALAPEYERSHFELLDLGNHNRHIEADLRDSNALGRAFDEAKPEFIFHLAALPQVQYSIENPSETLLLQLLRKGSILLRKHDFW